MAPRKPASSLGVVQPKPTNLDRAHAAPVGSFLRSVIGELINWTGKMLDKMKYPDNKDQLLAEAYMWDEIAKYAEARSKNLWKSIDEVTGGEGDDLAPGTHVLVEGRRFFVQAIVSQPVVRFNQDEMCRVLHKSKYKVPLAAARELVEKAKIKGKSTVTQTIIERTGEF